MQGRPSFVYTAAAAAEKACDLVGLEHYIYEPLPQVEQAPEVDSAGSFRCGSVPALEPVHQLRADRPQRATEITL